MEFCKCTREEKLGYYIHLSASLEPVALLSKREVLLLLTAEIVLINLSQNRDTFFQSNREPGGSYYFVPLAVMLTTCF